MVMMMIMVMMVMMFVMVMNSHSLDSAPTIHHAWMLVIILDSSLDITHKICENGYMRSWVEMSERIWLLLLHM